MVSVKAQCLRPELVVSTLYTQRWMNCMELIAPRKKTVGTFDYWAYWCHDKNKEEESIFNMYSCLIYSIMP